MPAFDTGRRWHRVWLEMTRLGLSAAPMTVLADDPEAASALATRFGRPEGARLVTVFRLGVRPDGASSAPARRPVSRWICAKSLVWPQSARLQELFWHPIRPEMRRCSRESPSYVSRERLSSSYCPER